MVKTDKDGKPYDASEAARNALNYLRNSLVLSGALGNTGAQPNNEALNLIADRLQTCDALEFKVERQKKAHAKLIQAAVAVLANIDRSSVDDDGALVKLADALSGVDDVKSFECHDHAYLGYWPCPGCAENDRDE